MTENVFRQRKTFFLNRSLHFMFVWPCIIDINNVADQLDATITIYWYSNQLNMFRAIFAHHQERKTVFYSMWYNAPKLLSATGRQQLGCIIPQAVKHRLALLRMGKKLPETCWADWNTKLLLLHLVGLLHYLISSCWVRPEKNSMKKVQKSAFVNHNVGLFC